MATGLLLGTLSAQAQLTWDITPGVVGAGDNAITSDAGTWDVATTGNWTSDAGANNVVWTDGSDAIFGDAGANYNVTIADGGVTVGDLTYEGTDRLMFLSATDNLGVITIKSGGATWNTGGGEILILGNQSADTSLAISSGDTLTVNGGGTFNTGEKPNGANWAATGATLDITEATLLKGNAASVGQFGTVKLADGSTFRAERNGNQTYANNWVLNGDVTFNTRWARQETLTGEISGTGRVIIDSTTFQENQVDQTYVFQGSANTYTGGTTVDGTSHVAVLGINNDNQLGAAPGAADADNVILKGGAYLRFNGAVTLDANRGITLENGGGFIASGSASTVAGKITGDGGLTIGRTADGSGNVITLSNSANDYTGGTTVLRGTVQLGADNAFGSGGALTLGGLGGSINSTVDLNGFNASVGGIQLAAGSTRQIRNNGASVSTITIDVATGESYDYASNFTGSQTTNIVKTGDGTQIFNRVGGYTTALGDITVSGGELVWDNTGNTQSGTVTVGTNGTLSGSGLFSGAVTISGALNPGNSPGTMTLNGGLTLEATSTLTLEFEGTGAGEYDVLLNDAGDILAAGGMLELTFGSFEINNGDTFTVFESWAGFDGAFLAINGTDLGGGLMVDTSNLLIDGTLTVVPEPSTYALLAGILVFAAITLRRRQS